MNTIAIIKVSEFRGANARADKNGLAPMFLTPIAGKVPNRALIQSGTICQREGLDEGYTFLVQINEGKANEFGRNFTVTMLDPMHGLELIKAKKELGEAIVVDVNSPESKPVVEAIEAAELAGELDEVTAEAGAADSGLE